MVNSIYELSLIVIRDKPRRYPYKCQCWQRAFFNSLEDADKYIRDNVEDWRTLNIFCIYVRKKPLGKMLYDDDSLSVWLYDSNGTLIDKRLCSNIDMTEEFHWRPHKDLRFHPGQIVEVLENEEVYLAYIPERPMTEADIAHYNEFVKDKVGDASDDIYTVLTTESYNSHQHIDALHCFHPHIKIHPATMKRFKRLYEANLKIDYSNETNIQYEDSRNS